MASVEITKDNAQSTIQDNDIVVLDFWASWCRPCMNFAPTFEAAAERHTDVVFGKVDTEDQKELAAEFQIRSIPMLWIFRENVPVFSQPGALQGPQLEQLIQQVKERDMDEVRAQMAAQGDN